MFPLLGIDSIWMVLLSAGFSAFSTVWIGLAALNFVATLVVGGLFFHAVRATKWLRDCPPAENATALPKVSLIAPARNEERQIEAAVRSLLRLDYPDLQITLVNDRSTDGTAAILDRLAVENPRLNVIHLQELPGGWLGKNHALQFGADHSDGEWLLFTDADVVFEPSAVRRAIRHAQENQVDHLVATPETKMPTWLLAAFVATFGLHFLLFVRAWAIRDKNSSAHVGVGAFNLIRARVYRAIGGHRPIAMRPDDDLKLGKLVKLHGYQQDLVNGNEMIFVQWYSSLKELIRGLEKNAFAALEYSVLAVCLSSLAVVMFNLFPIIALFFASGATFWLHAASLLVLSGLYLASAWNMKLHWTAAFGFPLAVLLFVYIQWRTMFLTFKNKGIQWRDTHYSLAELRANKV